MFPIEGLVSEIPITVLLRGPSVCNPFLSCHSKHLDLLCWLPVDVLLSTMMYFATVATQAQNGNVFASSNER